MRGAVLGLGINSDIVTIDFLSCASMLGAFASMRYALCARTVGLPFLAASVAP